MKKKIYVLLVIISMVAVLMAGCGKDDKDSATDNNSKETQGPSDNNQSGDMEEPKDNLEKEDISGEFTLTDTSDLATKYRGQTIEEFVMTGADIRGYSGVGGYYDFVGVNEEKGEIYTFTLSGEGLKEKLDNMEFTDEYEDVIGDFEIDTIEVVLVNDPALQKFVGITIEEFEKAGFEITGFDKMSDVVLKSESESGQTISITLEGDAVAKYETIEEPFDADMGAEFAEFVIKTVEFSVY